MSVINILTGSPRGQRGATNLLFTQIFKYEEIRAERGVRIRKLSM